MAVALEGEADGGSGGAAAATATAGAAAGGAKLGLHLSDGGAFATSDGVRTPSSAATRSSSTATVGLGLGRRTLGPLIAWYVRPRVGLRAPTFHGVAVDVALQVGVSLGGGR